MGHVWLLGVKYVAVLMTTITHDFNECTQFSFILRFTNEKQIEKKKNIRNKINVDLRSETVHVFE